MLNAYIDSAIAALNSLREMESEIDQAVATIVECLRRGGKVLSCGNGGSAAESAHFSTELLCRFEKDRPSLASMNLTADGSFLTATGNDYDFASLFSRQIDGLGRTGDVLVAFTTSGNSQNVLKALRSARTLGMKSIALLGRDGGEAKELADISLIVPAQSTAHIQEAHQVLLHVLCGEIEKQMFPNLHL